MLNNLDIPSSVSSVMGRLFAANPINASAVDGGYLVAGPQQKPITGGSGRSAGRDNPCHLAQASERLRKALSLSQH